MSLAQRLLAINNRIESALANSARPSGSVTLVAVSKRQPLELVQEYCRLQQAKNNPVFLGENYVQEFREKKTQISLPYETHLIGPLQRNKCKLAVALFDVIESVDSESLLRELNKEANKASKMQRIFLQVNISADPAKSGFAPEQLTHEFCTRICQYTSLSVQGLMTITELYELPEQARKDFRALRALADELRAPLISGSDLACSMGMSNDFEVAIEEGATHVRIGSALFGPRD